MLNFDKAGGLVSATLGPVADGAVATAGLQYLEPRVLIPRRRRVLACSLAAGRPGAPTRGEDARGQPVSQLATPMISDHNPTLITAINRIA